MSLIAVFRSFIIITLLSISGLIVILHLVIIEGGTTLNKSNKSII